MNRTFYAAAMGVAGLALFFPAHADGPDYDGTVSYIKSRLVGTLTERRQCVFGAKTQASGDEGIFHAGALDIVPYAIKRSEISFECAKAERCISFGSAEKKSALNFEVHDDAEGVAIAISRLVEMCGTVGR